MALVLYNDMTQLFSREIIVVQSITCFGILHTKSLLPSFESKLVFSFSNQQMHVVLCWQKDGRIKSWAMSSLLFVLSWWHWVAKQWEQQQLHHVHFFCHCVELIYQTFLKLVGQIAMMSFNQRRWTATSFCSPLREETIQILFTGFYFKTISSSCHYWHMLWFIMSNYCSLWITACVSNDKPQNTSAHNHDWLLSRWWQFCLLSTNRNFPLFTFSKHIYCPSIFLSPHPLPSQVFHFALVSSSLLILSTCSVIEEKDKKIEGCEHSNLEPCLSLWLCQFQSQKNK